MLFPKMKLTELKLPAIAFVDGTSHKGDTLYGRTVLLHVRSASVIEIVDDKTIINDGVPSLPFTYKNDAGAIERYMAVAHYINASTDYVSISREDVDSILKECAVFYKEYCAWEDKNLRENHISQIN